MATTQEATTKAILTKEIMEMVHTVLAQDNPEAIENKDRSMETLAKRVWDRDGAHYTFEIDRITDSDPDDFTDIGCNLVVRKGGEIVSQAYLPWDRENPKESKTLLTTIISNAVDRAAGKEVPPQGIILGGIS
jgi:hypothetical protein